jgi:hypothetical protein
MALSDTDTHHHWNRAPRRANIVFDRVPADRGLLSASSATGRSYRITGLGCCNEQGFVPSGEDT